MRRIRLAWFLAVVSCQAEPADPYPTPVEPQWEGEEILFGVGENAGEVCGGTREFLDRSTAALEDVAGEDVPKFSFFVVSDDEVDSLCRRESVRGCAAPGKAYAVDAALVHEVVHEVRHFSEGFPNPGIALFEEGIAELYSAHSNPHPPEKPQDLEALFERDVDDFGGLYEITMASYYLSSLATRYGDKAVWDFVTGTEALRDGGVLKDVFERHFPEPFEAFNERFLEEEMCSGAARSRKLVECSVDGPDLHPDFGDVVLPATETGYMECSSEEVIGPRAGEMWTTKTFDVLEETDVFMAVSFTDDPWEEPEDGEDPSAAVDDYVEIMPCGAGCSAFEIRASEGFSYPAFVALRRFGRADTLFGSGVLSTIPGLCRCICRATPSSRSTPREHGPSSLETTARRHRASVRRRFESRSVRRPALHGPRPRRRARTDLGWSRPRTRTGRPRRRAGTRQ